MFSGVVINPAYAGADEALSITAIHRNQWTGVENAPSTQTLSAHSLFKKKQFGIGFTFIQDEIGIHRNQNFLAQYAYHLPIDKKSALSFGLQGGVYHLKSDYASLGNANNDPKLYNPVNSQMFFDFGAGIYFRSKRLHAGLSVPELLPQHFVFNDTLSVSLTKANLFFYTRYTIPLNEFTDFQPNVLIKYMSNIPVSFDLTLNFVYRKVLTLGTAFRQRESVDLLLKMQVTPQLQLGYAYDHPIGTVSKLSSRSHELVVNYVFRNFEKKVVSTR